MPSSARHDPRQKRWILTHARVDADGNPILWTDTVIVDTKAELTRKLIDYGMPGFMAEAANAQQAPAEWFGNGTRTTWRFARPSLPTQREAFMTELRVLAHAENWRGVLDTVAARGVYLGQTARWRAACEWFGEAEREGRPIDWIAVQGITNLAHAM